MIGILDDVRTELFPPKCRMTALEDYAGVGTHDLDWIGFEVDFDVGGMFSIFYFRFRFRLREEVKEKRGRKEKVISVSVSMSA